MSMDMVMKRLGAAQQSPRPGQRPGGAAPKVDERDLLDRVRQSLYAEVSKAQLEDQSEESKKALRARIVTVLRAEAPGLSKAREAALAQEMMDDLFGWGPISQCLQDPEITEVMVNSPDDIWVERGGVLEKTDLRFRDEDHIMSVVQKIVGPIGRRVDESSPMVDARLPDGSRVNAVVKPLCLKGPVVTIRRFGKRLTAEDYVRLGSISQETLDFLGKCVAAKANILITGGTGTGKSTFLNVLSAFIPSGERIITIEDSAELELQQPHVVGLEARPANMEGKGAVSIRDLVRNSLRMRPDRIIVGEARGPEALDLLQAMNTGHEGSLATIHANTPKDAIERLAVMMMMAGEEIPHSAILQQIASSLDLIVHLSRMRDGSRKVTEISEVGAVGPDGQVEVRPVWKYELDPGSGEAVTGRLVPTGHVPRKLKAKFEWRNLPFDAGLFGGDAP